MSQDPALWSQVESFVKDPQQMNFYAYARNNPLLFVDPTGETAREFMNGMVMGYGRGGYNTISSIVKNPTSVVTGPFKALGQLYSDAYDSALSLGNQINENGVSNVYSSAKEDLNNYRSAFQNISDTKKGEMVGYGLEKAAETYAFGKAAGKVGSLKGYTTENSIGIKGERYGMSFDKYPKAGGGGLNLKDMSLSSNPYKQRILGIDYHKFGKFDSPKLHYHKGTGKAGELHRPYQTPKKD